MARKLTPQEIADKQIRRATAAVGDYKEGVKGVTESPTHKAARKVDKYKQGVLDAIDDGSFVDGLMGVGREEWIDATVTKGGDRYAKGVEASRSKIVEFQTQIAPHRDAIRAEVEGMDDTTLEDRLRRMEHNARRMAEFRFKKRSRRR